jgi:hypothetical protein
VSLIRPVGEDFEIRDAVSGAEIVANLRSIYLAAAGVHAQPLDVQTAASCL